MFFKWGHILFLGIFLGTSLPVFAVDRYRSFFSAPRALAMGDAYTAYSQGFESVYYNPAGVARKGPTSVKYIDLELAASYSVYSYLSDNVLSFYNLSQLGTNMASRAGTLHGMSIGFTPQLLSKNFSIGMIFKSSWDAVVEPGTLDFNIFGTTDLAVYLHYGVSFFGGVVKLGVGGKVLDRAELDRTYTAAEYGAGGISFTTEWKEGIGYGLDAGVMATAPIAGLPTIGIALQDFANTELLDRRVLWTGTRGTAGAPPALEQKVNVGVSFTLKHAPGVKSVIAMDVKDVLHWSRGDWRDHSHAGWEIEFDRILRIRAGYMQGRYWTAGLGLRLAGFNLELNTWKENLLIYTGSTRELRYYVAKYTLAF